MSTNSQKSMPIQSKQNRPLGCFGEQLLKNQSSKHESLQALLDRPALTRPGRLMVKQAKLLFMHSIEYDYAPTSFHNIWTKNLVNQGNRPLRNADNYSLPIPHTELFKKSPLYSLPCEWNKLDDNRYISNRTTFKTAIKYSLLHSLIDDLNA